MTETIGTILKNQRKELKQSQVQVADGICSQSMLSAIEHDQYIPNAQLLIALCRRLEISLETVSLATNYAISPQTSFNKRVVELCNQHHYQGLLTFLENEQVIQSVQTDNQTQAYYYYLAVAQLQATPNPNLSEVNQSLQLSLASATEQQKSLTRLAQVTSACVAAKAGRRDAALTESKSALSAIEAERYDENLNIVFYLAALMQHFLGQTQESMNLILKVIDFITEHDSHYMLANCYYLIAVIAAQAGEVVQQSEASAQSDFLAGLFKEQVYKF